MAKYRKKPVVVEAVQWTGDNLEEIKTFFENKEGIITIEPSMIIGNSDLYVTTNGYITIAGEGDYLVVGVVGDIYPLKPDIFHKTYEKE